MGKIQRNFEEDKQVRDQFNEMRERELKVLEQKIGEKFEAEEKVLEDFLLLIRRRLKNIGVEGFGAKISDNGGR